MSRPWHDMRLALAELECELRALGLWGVAQPAAFKLASVAPFCVDTLSFEEWLQWLFIPRMSALVDQCALLPSSAQLTPMGEQAFGHFGRRQQPLLLALARIDQLSRKLT